MPASDSKILRPATEFCEGEGDNNTLRLNTMSTDQVSMKANAETTDNEFVSGNHPNRGVRRRKSQELEKARRQKKRDESRHVLQFEDETTPNVRATRQAEKRIQRRMNTYPPTKENIPRLREQWMAECQKSFESQPDRLLPLRDINHKIPLIDENKRHNYRQPRCPEAFREALLTKIN